MANDSSANGLPKPETGALTRLSRVSDEALGMIPGPPWTAFDESTCQTAEAKVLRARRAREAHQSEAPSRSPEKARPRPKPLNTYMIAKIRFSPGGRSYPVNCYNPFVEPGDRVLVRMVGQQDPLRWVEVVETMDRKQARPCRNSVVCTPSEAEAYGRGPDDVKTARDLDQFLTSFHSWRKFSVRQENRLLLDDHWSTVYCMERNIFGRSMYNAIVAGPAKAARIMIYMGASFSNGTIDLTPPVIISQFDSDNSYRSAALFAEQLSVVEIVDSGRDTSIREIRSAISGGGAAYLGDGEWI